MRQAGRANWIRRRNTCAESPKSAADRRRRLGRGPGRRPDILGGCSAPGPHRATPAGGADRRGPSCRCTRRRPRCLLAGRGGSGDRRRHVRRRCGHQPEGVPVTDIGLFVMERCCCSSSSPSCCTRCSSSTSAGASSLSLPVHRADRVVRRVLVLTAEAEGGRRTEDDRLPRPDRRLGGLALVLALAIHLLRGSDAGRRGRRGSLTAARRVLSPPV